MALGDLVRSVGVFQTFDPFFNHISLAVCSFAPCHSCKMYEEVITARVGDDSYRSYRLYCRQDQNNTRS